MILLLWFGVCAVVLAATGVYGVIAETMAARRYEIAIRTALGAQRTRLARESIVRTMVFVLAGESVGAILVLAFGSVGAEVLYGVSRARSDGYGLGCGFAVRGFSGRGILAGVGRRPGVSREVRFRDQGRGRVRYGR